MVKLSKESLEAFQLALKEVDDSWQTDFNLREAVRESFYLIERARKYKVSWDKIAEILKQSSGIFDEISPESIRFYYFEFSRKSEELPKKKRKLSAAKNKQKNSTSVKSTAIINVSVPEKSDTIREAQPKTKAEKFDTIREAQPKTELEKPDTVQETQPKTKPEKSDAIRETQPKTEPEKSDAIRETQPKTAPKSTDTVESTSELPPAQEKVESKPDKPESLYKTQADVRGQFNLRRR